jgi:hypothetical protein
MTMNARAAPGLIWWSGGTMGIPFEIPPLLDVILTLRAMLGLFAYVYWLAGKEGRQMHSVDGIKSRNSDATVTPHERSAGMTARQQPHSDQWVSGRISRKITLYRAAKGKRYNVR